MVKVSVSILSSSNRKLLVNELNNTDCDYIHIDVMDGIFVNNKQFDVEEVNEISRISNKKLDVHLMMNNPLEYINKLNINNIEYITVHLEINNNINELLDVIKSYNIKCGLSIKPNTDISRITQYLNKLDLILIMSVEPGLGGQEFMMSSLDKALLLKQIIKNNNSNAIISIDGGVNDSNIYVIKKSGLDMVVCGSYITNSNNYQKRINNLR